MSDERSTPSSYDVRPDTGTTNVRLGMWLFLASEAMLFGSLFSGYVLLRAGSLPWPDTQGVLSLSHALVSTGLLGAAALALGGRVSALTRRRLTASTVMAVIFLAAKMLEYRAKIAAGLLPSTNLMLGSWYTLTAMHALHVAGGAVVTGWLAGPGWRFTSIAPARLGARLEAVRLYWYFVDLVWLGILAAFYIV